MIPYLTFHTENEISNISVIGPQGLKCKNIYMTLRVCLNEVPVCVRGSEVTCQNSGTVVTSGISHS